MTTIQQYYGLYQNDYIPTGSKEFYCGCEFEIESIKKIPDILKKHFIVDVDHSLRNNGHEFKTFPVTYDKALELFKMLHQHLVLSDAYDPFSERTSIHVHVNVAHFETEQLRQMVLAYALLEPLFFHYVGDVRKGSIFCVPLNYTYMPSVYKQPLDKMVEKWHKYTAFNLMPIKPQPDAPGLGTVEFRHLYGTSDPAVFTTWLTAIKQLYTWFVVNPTYNVIDAISSGETPYSLATKMIPMLAVLGPTATNEMCKDTMLDVKLSVGGLDSPKPKKAVVNKTLKMEAAQQLQAQIMANAGDAVYDVVSDELEF